MSEREDGFYWVKFNGEWVVAEWVQVCAMWFVPQETGEFPNLCIEQIDERRIVRQEPEASV